MDAIRGPAEKELKQNVIFNVDRLCVAVNWAYAKVSLTRPNGIGADAELQRAVESASRLRHFNERTKSVRWRQAATGTQSHFSMSLGHNARLEEPLF